MDIRKVTVYCASSRRADPAYRGAAGRLGALLAEAGVTIFYGGGDPLETRLVRSPAPTRVLEPSYAIGARHECRKTEHAYR